MKNEWVVGCTILLIGLTQFGGLINFFLQNRISNSNANLVNNPQ